MCFGLVFISFHRPGRMFHSNNLATPENRHVMAHAHKEGLHANGLHANLSKRVETYVPCMARGDNVL